MLGVVGDGRHVVVAAREPHATVGVAVGDRTALAQVVPDLGGGLGVGLLGVVEVGGPVASGLLQVGHVVPLEAGAIPALERIIRVIDGVGLAM